MKAIILAAGKGSRLMPITATKPKPLIKIFGKTLIEYCLESVYKYVDEIVLVVKYQKEKIISHFGYTYKQIKISYYTQGDKSGTGGALMGIEIENDDFLILSGDNIFEKYDLEKLIKFNGYGSLVKEVSNPEIYGIHKIDKNSQILEIIEKPEIFVGNLAGLGAYKLNHKILEFIKKLEISSRGEYEITDSINEYVKFFPLKAIKVEKNFLDIAYPWDILKSNSIFLNLLKKSNIKGIIEENTTIKGNIILETGAVIKSGTYIEGNCYFGKNSVIGPNAYIKGETYLGDNSKIGAFVEVKNTSIGDNTKISHLSYVGDSIIGDNVNLGAGTKTANFRHDKKNIKVVINKKLIDSGRNKFGAIVGDNTKTGTNTIFYPGRIINNDSFTLPGEIIK